MINKVYEIWVILKLLVVFFFTLKITENGDVGVD